MCLSFFFFFSSRRRHTRSLRDWSSDVCSSDLEARQDDWAEFVADCGKFSAEIDREISKGKFTLAELEEEEQSLDRLRRWHRELAARDVFGAPGAAEAVQQLKHCAERLDEYTDLVFRAIHQM